MEIRFKKLRPAAVAPTKATIHAAGFDLRACLDESLDVKPMQRVMIPTGLALELPALTEAQIRPRSGLAWKHGLTILNAPGTIDSDFRGELCVLLINLGSESVAIAPSDRIAQLVVSKLHEVNFVEADVLSGSERGEGGFGSTGKQ